ncbi:SH3 domain-containing protein [Rheinheimera maricola]|uniref:SH3 domain-containing protein n=1 Tax=Rheinheimera maricola TaxID=2793282 RepID=A0ABS7X7X2_9GAMM|nr:SH3 domain-containing protein [Rheinheimera maricola]MBZ9611651.1 SH3 domain-containing protein [Rheinheimera maricola]
MAYKALLLLLLTLSSNVHAQGWGSKLGEWLSDFPIADGWNWLITLNDVVRITPDMVRAARLQYVVVTESGSNVFVRSAASTKASALTQIAHGSVVILLAKEPFTPWFEVELPDGTIGYIHQSLLAPLSNTPKQ